MRAQFVQRLQVGVGTRAQVAIDHAGNVGLAAAGGVPDRVALLLVGLAGLGNGVKQRLGLGRLGEQCFDALLCLRRRFVGGGHGGFELIDVAAVDGLERRLGADPVELDAGGPLFHQGLLLHLGGGEPLGGLVQRADTRLRIQHDGDRDAQDAAKRHAQAQAYFEVAEFHCLRGRRP